MGFDAAVQEMNAPKSKAAGIILASDVSPKTEKEICFHAEKRGTPVVHLSLIHISEPTRPY